MRKIIREILFRIRGDYTTEKLIKMGMKVGKNFLRLNGVILDPSHCWLISIGDNVTLAPRVHVLAHDASTKTFLDYTKIASVTIGDNVFIGSGSILLPNIEIGSNVVIGAGSVVSKNLPANAVYAGNPAKFICSLEEYLKKNTEKMKESPIFSEEYTIRGKITHDMKVKMKNELSDRIGYVK